MKPNFPSMNRRPRRQRGVVLIIALVMLVVISLLAALSIRNAQSTEGVSGNVRTTQLANEAAEIALRYCESAVVANAQSGATLPTGMAISSVPVGTALGVTTSNWDSTRSGVYALPTTSVNNATLATYQRVPESVNERRQVVTSAGSRSETTTYLITARGFGPEVADGTGRPDGTEGLLQATLEVQ